MIKSTQKQVQIVGTGSYLPVKKLDNHELAQKLGVTGDWIFQRTGILQRHVAGSRQATSDLAVEAAIEAIRSSGVNIREIDLIIAATSTPDTLVQPTACRVQQKLGAESAAAFDLGAACSGFLYGLATANGYIQSGLAENVLLIAAETRTRFINYNDPNTSVLYGDGAGAVILSGTDKQDKGLIYLTIGADGKGIDAISIPAGGSRMPASQQTVKEHLHYIQFKKSSVLVKHAARCIAEMIHESLHHTGTASNEIDLIIPHQMNLRIIEIAARKAGIPIEKFYVNIDKCGNTSAASIPIALDEAVRQKKIRSGCLVLFVAFGTGFAWGAALTRW